jgi:hypothetical protein
LAALGDGERRDLLGEVTVLLGGGGALVAERGELVLLLAGDAQRGAAALGGLAHRDAVPRVGEPVERHVVADRHVAELGALPLVDQVRRVGHRLHAAGHHDVELAGPDQLVGQRDRVEPGETHLVDRDGRRGHRDAGHDRGLPGGDLAGAGLQHLAHDHVLDLVGADAAALEGGLDRVAAERGGGKGLQIAEQAAHRSAGATDDYRRGHG